MKYLLKLLAVAVVGSSTVAPNIALNTKLINYLFDFNINLSIKRIFQEASPYCVPASIQMVFAFYGMNLDHFSQDHLFQVLDGNDDGIVLDSRVAYYLNINIPSSYEVNILQNDFGLNIQEQWAFQNYVYDSLYNNHPLIFGHTTPGTNVGHAVVISGIELNNSNPELTRYTFLDPDRESPAISHFTGAELSTYLHHGGEILGRGINPDFQSQGISIAINNREIGEDKLNDYEDHEVVKIRTDITTTIGATTTGNFAQMIDKISLPEFNGEIYNFTWRKSVKSFSIPITNIPNDNDNWLSPKIEIASSSENSGSAHIEGRIIGQIKFERTKSLNHLLVYLIIYVGGISWSTRNWAHVWFQTGSILDFTKK